MPFSVLPSPTAPYMVTSNIIAASGAGSFSGDSAEKAGAGARAGAGAGADEVILGGEAACAEPQAWLLEFEASAVEISKRVAKTAKSLMLNNVICFVFFDQLAQKVDPLLAHGLASNSSLNCDIYDVQ